MENLHVGMRVLHPLFGGGLVRAISGSGPSAKVTVDFSRNVGSKVLLAGVAKLTPLDPEVDEEQRRIWGEGKVPPAEPPPVTYWYESLDLECVPKPGRYPPREKLHEAIRRGLTEYQFWTAIREGLAKQGAAPKVLDQPSGNVSISTSGLFNMRIRVRHDEMIEESRRVTARAIYDSLAARYLGDFERFTIKEEFSTQGALIDSDIVEILNTDMELPGRDPRRRPLPVRPKGTISNRPKRRDDY